MVHAIPRWRTCAHSSPLPLTAVIHRRRPLARHSRAINRDVLIPRKHGRFAFGRLIDRQGKLVGVLPPGHGQKQEVVSDPAWIAVAEMLVRRL